MQFTTLRTRRILLFVALVFAFAASVTATRGILRSGSTGVAPANASTKPVGKLARRIPVLQAQTNTLRSAFDWRNDNWLASPSAFLVPNISVVKSAALATDVNGNTFINPGDTLMYSVVVSNTGTDATGVVFTDQLNGNLTLANTPTASPIAVNDTYASIGNVGISVPAANGVFANDINPQGSGAFSVVTVNQAGLAGLLSVNTTTGAFDFTPNAGFEGTTSFTYTLGNGTGKTDTATVTINVSGMIWFIDNNAGSTGDGRLGAPFNSIANYNSLAADDPGDNIFLYRNTATNYTGPLTLQANQKLGGAGMTVSLASFTGLTVPPFSNPLPATSGTRPTLTNTATNVTVSTGNTIRGVNIQNTTAGSALLGTSFNNLTISETTVTSSNATAAINLNQSSGTAAITADFISVNASTCANGIILQNTTGSFTVNGDGSNTSVGGNSTGGTLSNMSGADNAVAGSGVYLNNVQNVTLRRMTINGTNQNFGIRGNLVSGFALEYSTVGGTNGTNFNTYPSTHGEGSIYFGSAASNPNPDVNGITGTGTFTNNNISGGQWNNCDFVNGSGTVTLTFKGNTFGANLNNGQGNHSLAIEARGNSTMNSVIGGTNVGEPNTFTAYRAMAINITAQQGTSADAVVRNNVISNNHPGNNIGGGNMSFQGAGTITFHVTGNTMRDADGSAVTFFKASGSGTPSMTGFFDNNTIGVANVANSGSKGSGNGIFVSAGGTGTMSFTITNNQIHQISGNFHISADNTGGSYTANFDIRGNTFDTPGAGNAGAIGITNGSPASTDTVNVCAIIGGASASDRNTISGYTSGTQRIFLGSSGVNNSATHIFNLPGLATFTEAGIEAFVAGNNTMNGTVVDAYNDHMPSTFAAFKGNAGCGTPTSIASPIDVDEPSVRNQSDKQAQHNTPSGSAAPNFLTRVRQWLQPAWTAFSTSLSYVNLDRAFGRMAETAVPTVTAAEHVVPPSGGNDSTNKLIPPEGGTTYTNKPARTMVINSRGEARVVPTASLPAALSGETVTINGTGAGFTLPAGESTTIMFNATIAAGFTGTAITNQASVSGTGFGPVLSNNLSTPVIQPPNFTKAFSPTTIATNTGVSTLTFTLVNPNPAQSLSNVSFTDSLLNNLQVAATPAASTISCGSPTWAPTANSTSLTFSGGSIAAGGTCTVSVNVKATTEGSKPNTSSTATSTEANASGTASATLTVINAPTFSKAFGASSVPLNGSTSLTFTITNNSAISSLSGIGFTDTLPAGLIVATPSNGLSTTCTGTPSATAGGGSISLTGASLATSGSCTLTVNVTGTTTGAKPNSATLATTELGASSATTGTVTLTVLGPPTISKASPGRSRLAASSG
ncbi:MAG TPA: Ig-like domain-containing protein, partial [Blastocatellia bacterium]|nr:Ig-like domain-containing protein [Blastocatellia bacterium]